MKKISLVLLAMLMMLLVIGCGEEEKPATGNPTPTTAETTPEATKAPEATEAPEVTPTPALTEEEIWYQEMIEDSLVSTGNNSRVRDVIERAKAGEDVYIAAIGGSITEGEGAKPYMNCYAFQTYMKFLTEYAGGGSNVHFINAGISGTPSTLGVLRYQRDVIDKNEGHQPDLVIVEFAVNDGDDPTKGETYEGLVRHILQAENDPAVVLVFSVFQSKWNLQDRLQPIGEYYGLPMVSIKDAVVPRLNDGSLTDAKFFNDQYHPTTYGHTIMADCLGYLFACIMAEEKVYEEYTVPEEGYLSTNFENVQMIDSTTEGVDITVGGFSKVDSGLGTIRYDNTKTFPNNWKHDSTTGDESFVMKLNCKNLLMTYKSSGSAGSVDIYVDGTLVKTVKGSDGGAWSNPYTVLVLDEDVAAEHTIEITMAAGSEAKDFSILAFGYSE